MGNRWANILGKVLIVLGGLLLVADLGYELMEGFFNPSFSGRVEGILGYRINAMTFILPGLLLVGFNRVLNKLEELKEDKSLKDERSISRFSRSEKRHHKEENDNIKDFKYVSRR